TSKTREHTSGAEGRVSLEQDPKLLTVLLELVLRQEWVQLNLVHGGDDGPGLLELLEVGDGPVGETNGLHLTRSVDLLHLAPGLGLVPGAVDGAGAVRVDGEELVRLVLQIVSDAVFKVGVKNGLRL